MTIDTSQNVGIGTSSPSAKLQVQGSQASGTANVLYLDNSSVTGTTLASVSFSNAGSVKASIAACVAGDGYMTFNNNNNSEKMRLDASGNVGIGTSSPSYKLDVSATGNISGQFKTSGSINALYLADAGTTAGTLYIGTVGNDFRVVTGSNERMRIDTSGNVGIGCVPSAWGSFYKVIQSTAASTFCITTQVNDIEVGSGYYNVNSGFSSLYINTGATKPSRYMQSNGVHIWQSANTGTAGNTISWTSALTLDASGNLLVNGTSPLITSPSLNLFSGNQSQICFRNTSATAGHYWQMGHNNDSFIVYNAANAGVYITYGGTSWTGTSDERLKNITGTIQNGLLKVASLRAAEFTWKADDANKPQVGLIAQDVQKVLPEVVDIDAQGNLGVRYSEVVPLLVAALQELSAKNDALEARLAALESK